MNATDDLAMRYLLGELPEQERDRLESEYFADPLAFDRLEHFENQLIDDYARGRLSGETRRRFEAAYLADPARRQRLKFGEALAARIDRRKAAPVTRAAGGDRSWLRALVTPLGTLRPALAFSVALALLLLLCGSVWLFVESRRLRMELAESGGARVRQEQREAELQQQLSDEQKRNQELTVELQNALAAQTKPSPETPAPAFVTLLLTAAGIRGAETGPPARLVIPKGTEEVRVRLTLKDNDYRDYQIVLGAIGGQEILNRKGVKPRISESGAVFGLSLPASKLSSGDYMLTLKGASQGGEIEDVSKSLFRVDKK